MKLIFDVALDSDIDLPELPDISTAETVIKIREGTDNTDWIDELVWQFHWQTEDGQVCISRAQYDAGYVLRFPELSDFVVPFSNHSIEYYADITTPPESIRHLLLDQVIPRVLGQQGRLVLHASATVLQGDDEAIAFVGDSGWGKSTIASSFLEDGARLLTDDCLLIEICDDHVFCIPNYYGVRLFDDSAKAIFADKQHTQVSHYSTKKRLRMDHHYGDERSAPIKLAGIFLLDDPAKNTGSKQIEVKPITGAADFIKLVGQIFSIDASERSLYETLFKKVGNIVSHGIPIYQLDYPRDYTILSSVQKCVRNTVHKT